MFFSAVFCRAPHEPILTRGKRPAIISLSVSHTRVGTCDYMDDVADNDQGYPWYAGAKWRIDFQGGRINSIIPSASRGDDGITGA
jgi:hypothetical protein